MYSCDWSGVVVILSNLPKDIFILGSFNCDVVEVDESV